MNINLREPSTQRGIVMLMTGATVLYKTRDRITALQEVIALLQEQVCVE